jgi:hypothetical protein
MNAAQMQRLLSLLLSIAVCFGALLSACSETQVPRFPHRLHLTGLACGVPGKPKCLTCNSCHSVSQPAREYKLPSSELCQDCHRDEQRQILATLTLAPPRISGQININHDQHLRMPSINGQCVSCHSGVVRAGESTLPPMSRCFSCHEHQEQWNRSECTPCHETKDLKRTLPRTFLQHDAAFMRRHGDVAAHENSLCQSCHTQKDCQVCHDVTQNLSAEARKPESFEGPFMHRGDFLSRHAIEARAASARCATCHTPETCDSCHVARGVSGNASNARNPHPPGWVSNISGAGNLHGSEARRDILLCAGCHDQGPATNCIRCHKVGAYGGNPHPAGFRSGREPNAEMCRYCHE